MSNGTRKIWSWHGGLKLPGHKAESTGRPIQSTPLARHYWIPLQQHIGESAEAVVTPGDQVYKGDMLAHAQGYYSAAIHAPTSGTVVDIREQPVAHPSGLSAPCVILKPDGEDRWTDKLKPYPDYEALDPSELRNRLRDAGIVGLGGAGFPTYIKLNPGGHPIDTLILNGAECEPYITCDDMLMRERPGDILRGMKIMQHALQAKQLIIGIEDNKPIAREAMQTACVELGMSDEIEIVDVPTRYPAGGEKQLIKTLTGKEVPSNGLPLDIGVVCQNVGTAAAVADAILKGQPLLNRIVTVTGAGVKQPANFDVRIGTPISELVQWAGGYTDKAYRLIMGGPMMGFSVTQDEIPISKTINCVLAGSREELPQTGAHMPCIRCGACVDVCPARLLPQQLYWYAQSRDLDKIQDYNLFDCIECGCCAYVCPSQIPLVQYYRFAKTEIWEQEREKQKADIARRRHEFRLERLERDKAEREERLRKKKQALDKAKGKKSATADPKKAVIEAALARVREKQAQQEQHRRNTDNLTAEQQQKIAEVDARRAQKKTLSAGSAQKDESTP